MSDDAIKRAEALLTLIRECVRFADWAAGQGIAPVEGESASDPEDVIMAFLDHVEVDWDAGFTDSVMAQLAVTASDLAGLAEGKAVVVPVDLIWRLDDALSLYEDPIAYDRASFSGGDGNIVVPDRYDEIGFGDTAANVRGLIPETVRGAISRWLDKIIAARPGAKEE